MASEYQITRITHAKFKKLSDQYKDVCPQKLDELDEQRYTNIPRLVHERQSGEGAFLTKDELVKLVHWKLSHGKFRPTLAKLVQQNAEDDVRSTTSLAFAAVNLKDALAILTKLRGVGPATASLLLSVNKPEKAPFFSDQLFQWCFWEDKPGHRWDRKIKYSSKEYCELAAEVDRLRERFDNEHGQAVSAVDIEKVAFVLGGQDLAPGDGGGKSETSLKSGTSHESRKRNIDALADEADASTKSPRPSKKAPEASGEDAEVPDGNDVQHIYKRRRSNRAKSQGS